MAAWSMVVALLLAPGCGGEQPASVGSDSGVPVEDAAVEAPDAGDPGPEDGGRDDAGTQIVPVDEDEDGHFSDVDCDDANPEVHPGAEELCNGRDDDCDGATDEAEASDAQGWFADADGDGYGDAASTQRACAAPQGYVADDRDCDDTDAEINPEASEMCNAVDDNCDGAVDEDGAIGSTAFHADVDRDGYGDPSAVRNACSRPEGFVTDGTDCDDANSSIHPFAAELCNGVDDNCDTEVDEDSASDAGSWFLDSDGDGFGNPADSVSSCEQPPGRVANDDDCNDADAAFYPGAPDQPDARGEDTNCDGIDGDAASSVFVSANSGNDTNSGILPSEPVRTLERAMAIARGCTPSYCSVLVAEGTYRHSDSLELVAGVSLYGGYADGLPAGSERAWERNKAVANTVIESSNIPTIGADQIDRDTVLDRFTIQGADATGYGQAAIAVLVTNTPSAGRLTLSSSEIIAGDGGTGSPGAQGLAVSCTPATGGAGGDNPDCASASGQNGSKSSGSLDGIGGTGGAGGPTNVRGTALRTPARVAKEAMALTAPLPDRRERVSPTAALGVRSGASTDTPPGTLASAATVATAATAAVVVAAARAVASTSTRAALAAQPALAAAPCATTT
ncbi:MAG TPA: hypothetical protein DFS52_11285 [Myxococcales bacterium]|nr:hypothetical protein [Myxococcales bacterium]